MSDVDLYAEFSCQNNEDVEIDLEFIDDYDDAVAQAREELDMDDNDDDLEFIGVNVYAANPNLQHYADMIDWDDMFSTNQEEVIKEFLALDAHDQLAVMFVCSIHGASLKESIEHRGSSFVQVFGSKDEMVYEWAEHVDRDTLIRFLDKDAIIKEYYRLHEDMPSGDIIFVNE